MSGNLIVACGGQTGELQEDSKREMMRLTPYGPNVWEKLPPMSFKRIDCSAVAIENKLVQDIVIVNFFLT